jgi:hypothetical protein
MLNTVLSQAILSMQNWVEEFHLPEDKNQTLHMVEWRNFQILEVYVYTEDFKGHTEQNYQKNYLKFY